MNMKHSLRSALLLVPLLATAAFAGIYYEEEMTSPAGKSKTFCYISGAKRRLEPQGTAANGIAIERFDESKLYYLMPQNKMYMEMTIPKATPQEEAQVEATVIKTDETKRIGNHNCTRYDVTTKGIPGLPPQGVTVQWWMTTDVDVSEEYEKLTEAQCRATSAKLATEMAKVKGFPMEMVSESPGAVVTMTVTTVKKQDIPDSVFEVPADYTNASTAPATTPPAAPPAGGVGAGKSE
jgi:hypothetical protein